jgi:hypothetical protein
MSSTAQPTHLTSPQAGLQDLDRQVNEAFDKLLALREMTAETGTVTVRAQNQVLQSLPHDVLARVAVLLKRAKLNARGVPQGK